MTRLRRTTKPPVVRAVRGLAAGMGLVLSIASGTAVALLVGAAQGGRASAAASGQHLVPEQMQALYREAAATCPGLSWTVLAGVGQVETHHGADPGVSSAGAMGPMQFMPDTWTQYGVDASGDGKTDIQDPKDSVFSAAGMLCRNGATQPGGLRGALWAYNHSTWYVDLVVTTASLYGAQDALPAIPEAGTLLSNPRLLLAAPARHDLEAGGVDPRVLRILAAASQEHTLSVSVFRSGHSPFVEGTTRLSNHLFGRAVDIYAVDGQAVSPSSPAARVLVESLLALTGPDRPTEIGHPFPFLTGPGSFSDAGHADHIHVGFDTVG